MSAAVAMTNQLGPLPVRRIAHFNTSHRATLSIGVPPMKSTLLKMLLLAAIALLGAGPALAQESKDDAKASDAKKSEAKSTIAVFRLSGSLSETPTDEGFPFSTEHTVALKDLVE